MSHSQAGCDPTRRQSESPQPSNSASWTFSGSDSRGFRRCSIVQDDDSVRNPR